MAEPRMVTFTETRQIRRKNETIQWRARQTYPYDPDMDPMIEIGHAHFARGEIVAPKSVEPVDADHKPSRAERRMQRQAPAPLTTPARVN